MDLNSCWRIFIDGDKRAFQELYEQMANELFAYGLNLCKDRDQVLDAIHDLFVHLYGNKKIAREVNVKYYLFAALRRRILAPEKITFESLSDGHDSGEIMDSRELEIIRDETRNMNDIRLQAQISQLPRRQREILHLRYTLDLSYPEIAEIMDINIETCRTLCHRAMRFLKGNLKLLELATVFIFLFF